MRELKFRVYAKVKDADGCFGYLETRSPAATGIDFFYDGSWRGISYFIQYPEIFEVQQYTGLRDKNDKEIYEGDILKLHDESRDKTIGDVYFGSGAYHVRSVECLWFGSKYGKCEDYEIIGNVFDNPELLEK